MKPNQVWVTKITLVCLELMAGMDAQLNHASVWNIEPVNQDGNRNNPIWCYGGELPNGWSKPYGHAFN